MSEDHHDRINNEDDDSGFYNAGKSEESEEKEEQENIPSKSDAFKSSKHKKIHKREKGHAKKKSSKQEQRQRKEAEQAQEQAEGIIEEMEKRYDEDRQLYEKKKPASRKLTYLPVLSKKLRNLLIWDKFLELGGLQQFQLWFTKLPQGIEPSLTLRKGLLEILDSLKVKSEHITRVASIQRIVQKHKKSQTKELRDLSESILLKWSKTLHQQQAE